MRVSIFILTAILVSALAGEAAEAACKMRQVLYTRDGSTAIKNVCTIDGKNFFVGGGRGGSCEMVFLAGQPGPVLLCE
jgi:hypothetical protein